MVPERPRRGGMSELVTKWLSGPLSAVGAWRSHQSPKPQWPHLENGDNGAYLTGLSCELIGNFFFAWKELSRKPSTY